jgi:hypothetical protein
MRGKRVGVSEAYKGHLLPEFPVDEEDTHAEEDTEQRREENAWLLKYVRGQGPKE